MGIRYVNVRLTSMQVEALLSLCAYASAGGHEDVGMEPVAFARLDAASERLARALDARDSDRRTETSMTRSSDDED